jgi:hypothetical protein
MNGRCWKGPLVGIQKELFKELVRHQDPHNVMNTLLLFLVVGATMQ